MAIRDIIVFNIRRIIFIVNIIHFSCLVYDGKKKINLYKNFKNNIKLKKEKINYMDIIQDSNEKNDFINYHLEKSSNILIKKRNNFYTKTNNEINLMGRYFWQKMN